jgi:hypothetical protein
MPRTEGTQLSVGGANYDTAITTGGTSRAQGLWPTDAPILNTLLTRRVWSARARFVMGAARWLTS